MDRLSAENRFVNMEERYIASVDLGTSKFAVCVAKIQDRSVEVVYYKETPSTGISYSYVINPGKVQKALREAISEAQQTLKIKILQVIVGLPRWYVRQETASASMVRPNPDDLIQESEIRELKTRSLDSYPLESPTKEIIYGAVAQSFSTEDSINEPENDIVGMASEKLEGNFKVFIGNRRYSSNIDSVFNDLGIAVAKKYFTPGITARAVLKQEQMENGVALIDIGAGVSSVTIFKDKIMRFYAAIPFGGNSITKDIKAECNFSFDLAENIKIAYGACMPNKLASLGEKTIQIVDEEGTPSAQVPVKYISEIITARMKEIIEALLYKIQESGYASESELRAGVVVTGGGADLVNCANFIKELSGYSVKIGKPRHFFTCEGYEEAGGVSAATSMGMILSAKSDRSLNCVNDATTIATRRIDPTPAPKPVSSEEPKPEKAPDPVEAATEKPAEVEENVTNIPERVEVTMPEEVVPAQTEEPEVPVQHVSDDEDYDPYSQAGRTQETGGTGEVPDSDNDKRESGDDEDEPKENEKHPAKERKPSPFKWIKNIVRDLYDKIDDEEV